jgi:hypothetical protein
MHPGGIRLQNQIHPGLSDTQASINSSGQEEQPVYKAVHMGPVAPIAWFPADSGEDTSLRRRNSATARAEADSSKRTCLIQSWNSNDNEKAFSQSLEFDSKRSSRLSPTLPCFFPPTTRDTVFPRPTMRAESDWTEG